MKFLIAVLVAVVAFESTANAASLEQRAPLQVAGSVVATVVKAITTVVTKYDTIINNQLLKGLENVTEIQEKSAQIQTTLGVGTTKVAFFLLSKVEEILGAELTEEQIKLADCLIAEESSVVEIVENAFYQNGWCNNRLAGNVTSALQELTAAILPVSEEIEEYAESLSKCILGDTVCLSLFVTKVAALSTTQAAGGKGTIVAAFKDVVAIYKIMFGEDMLQCADDVLFPALEVGNSTIYAKVESCVNA